MLDTVRDRLTDFKEQVANHDQSDQYTDPNERNAGITVAESAVAFVAALGATLLTREVLEATWRTTLDRDPPKNPASSEVEWKEALMWGAASGALVGLARIASRRLSTSAYRRIG